jgi:hypothetical protein
MESNDGGASFNPFDEHIQSIGCVAIDPSKPDQNIWVGTGETWTKIVFPWEMAFTSRQMEVRTGRTWDYLNLVVIIVDQRIAILFGLVFLVPCGEIVMKEVFIKQQTEDLEQSSFL